MKGLLNKKKTGQITYLTKGKKLINVHYASGIMLNSEVKTDLAETRRLCSLCVSQSYSCPPYSPDWGSLSHKKYLGVVWCWVNTNEWHTYNTKYDYYTTSQISSVVASMMKRVGYELDKKFNTKYYSTGSCRICKPCNSKRGLPCKYPEKKRYALESTGVIVDSLTERFDHKLLWKKSKSSTKNYLPEYTTAVIAIELGVLTGDFHNVISNFMKGEGENVGKIK